MKSSLTVSSSEKAIAITIVNGRSQATHNVSQRELVNIVKALTALIKTK